jgi:hypothetical protein
MTLFRRIFIERRRVTIPLLLFLAGNVAVLLLVVLPMQRSVAVAADARTGAARSLTEARGLDLQAKAQRTGKERADVELKKFYGEILPADFHDAVKLASFWLGREADASRLVFRTGQWDRDAVRESRLTKVTGQVLLAGEYADLLTFLHRVETADQFVVIEKVELSQSESGQGSSPLEVSLTVATYYLTEGVAGGARQ